MEERPWKATPKSGELHVEVEIEGDKMTLDFFEGFDTYLTEMQYIALQGLALPLIFEET